MHMVYKENGILVGGVASWDTTVRLVDVIFTHIGQFNHVQPLITIGGIDIKVYHLYHNWKGVGR